LARATTTSPVSIGWRSVSSTGARKFGKLVHEQHAVMRKADLARLGAPAAAHDRAIEAV
jgi:hypothetical protein